jgi:intracellular multiplication protein IcmT
MSKQVAELREQLNWHWRNSMRSIRFFGLDARSAFPFVFLLPYARVSTLILAVLVVAFFVFLEKRGLSFPAAMRASRTLIFGNIRPALMTFRHRKLRDFG